MSRWSQQHFALSRLHPWKWLQLWGGQNLNSKEKAVDEVVSNCLGLAYRSTSSHILTITSSSIPPSVTCSYNFMCSLFPAVCSGQLARGVKSMEVVLLMSIWLYWRQLPQQQYRHMQEKTTFKIIIPQISNNFSQQCSCDLNHWLIKALGRGLDHSECSLVSSCDLIKMKQHIHQV